MNFNTIKRGLGIFKRKFKCTKIYIVGSSERLFINKKIYLMLKISIKRHVLSVFYLI